MLIKKELQEEFSGKIFSRNSGNLGSAIDAKKHELTPNDVHVDIALSSIDEDTTEEEGFPVLCFKSVYKKLC